MIHHPSGTKSLPSRTNHPSSSSSSGVRFCLVSRRLPTEAARVRAPIRSCGICGGQSGTGSGFLRLLGFPPPIRIPPIAPQSSSSIIWGWHNRPDSGRSLTAWKKIGSPPRGGWYDLLVATRALNRAGLLWEEGLSADVFGLWSLQHEFCHLGSL
jgi:hypothetical protein